MARLKWPVGSEIGLALLRQSSGMQPVPQRRQKTSGLQNPASWLFDAVTDGTSTDSGVAVGPRSAAAHADVYACVRVLADAVASVPLISYRNGAGGRERVTTTPTARLIDHPHPLLTQAVLWSIVVAHLCLHGESFQAKLRIGNGAVQRLWPLNPALVTVDIADGEPVYTVSPGEGVQGGVFSRRDILHIKGMTFDGVRGVAPIAQARQALGMGIAMEKYGAKFFANSGYPGGVIQMPGTLTDEASGRLKADWDAFHRGLQQAHRVAVLEGGATFNAINIPPEDAQFIEQRRYSATQIARIFRVPPWMIGADSGSTMTYSNVEQQQLQFALYTVRPLCTYIEQAFAADEDLYPRGQADDPFPEFLLDSLLRADTATRFEAYAKAKGSWMTVNEIRRLENLPDMPDGDELASAPAGEAGAPATDDQEDMMGGTPNGVPQVAGLYMPERDERLLTRALGLAADAHRRELHDIMSTLRAADGTGLAPVINVQVEPTPVVVQLPEVTQPNVNVLVQPAEVTVLQEGPKTITIQRGVDGRMKGAKVDDA